MSLNAATTLELKPQRGASGVPFMHSKIGAEESKALILSAVVLEASTVDCLASVVSAGPALEVGG